MTGNACGEASEFAVNRVSADVLLPDSKTLKLHTSAFMICMLSDKNGTAKIAFFVSPHGRSEERLMGKGKWEEIQMELGTDIMTDERFVGVRKRC